MKEWQATICAILICLAIAAAVLAFMEWGKDKPFPYDVEGVTVINIEETSDFTIENCIFGDIDPNKPIKIL